MRIAGAMLIACCVLQGCTRPVAAPATEHEEASPATAASVSSPVFPIGADIFYPAGPGERFATLDRSGTLARERRSRSTVGDLGTWTVTIDEGPMKDGGGAYALHTRLTLSSDERGILLHELYNAKRDSTAVFSPALRLMPAEIRLDAPQHASSASVRIVEGDPKRPTIRTGKATATMSLAAGANEAVASTRLRMTTGPAIIDRVAVLHLVWRDQWTVAREDREFAVRVGPIAIESDSLVATPE
jgi:hypothetical protein